VRGAGGADSGTACGSPPAKVGWRGAHQQHTRRGQWAEDGDKGEVRVRVKVTVKVKVKAFVLLAMAALSARRTLLELTGAMPNRCPFARSARLCQPCENLVRGGRAEHNQKS
jgi:hypothetical protein